MSPLFAIITEFKWSYIAGLISFIPSITIPLFNIGGSMVRSSVVFWIISVVLMLLLTALSMYLYRKNYGKQKGDGSIEAEIKKTNKVMILIPMVILSIITYVVYLKNPVNSNIFVLNMILTVYVLYLGCLYLFLKEKEAIKYLLIYLLTLQFIVRERIWTG